MNSPGKTAFTAWWASADPEWEQTPLWTMLDPVEKAAWEAAASKVLEDHSF